MERRKKKLFCFILFLVCFFFLLSCDSEQRHRVLTFFFDGVPPLGSEDDVLEDTVGEIEVASGRVKKKAPVIYKHEPYASCDPICHGERSKSGFGSGSKVRLGEKIPGLCFECHPVDYEIKSGINVHGPVAVGVCLFCHSAHDSVNKHLLKETVPDLCYRCHDQRLLEMVNGHSDETMAKCLSCHHGHKSTDKALLRKERGKADN